MSKRATQDRDAVKEKPPREPRAEGIACPDCGCRHLEVIYTRHRIGMTLRRRECRHCGRRISTRETAS